MKKKIFLLLVFLFFGVCSFSQVPDPHVLLSPPDSSLVRVGNAILDWSYVPNTVSYRVQISIHQNFDTLPPPPPILYSINGGNPVYADSINIFKWSHVYTATSYRIQIRQLNPIIDQTTTDTVFFVPPGTFISGSSYNWRVAAINNGGQTWSAIFNFIVYLPIPAPPVLIAPCDGTNISLTPTLTWNASSGAMSYRVQVSNSPNFINLIVNAASIVNTQYIITPGILNYDSTYFWRVNAANSMGTSAWSSVCHFTTISSIGIKILSSEVPTEFKLCNNYPNPFNPVTKIKFQIPKGFPIGAFGNDNVVIKVYDILGKEITTLVNAKLQPGTYEITFDGSGLPSGVYFYRLTTDGFSETKKIMLIK